MKIHLVVLASLFLTAVAKAGGSLGWAEVCQRLEKDGPKLLVTINQCFDVSPVGGAIRLGPRSIDVIHGKSGVGDRVPPYEFDCKAKGTPGPYDLRIEISDWDDGWKFIIREKAMVKPESGTGESATQSKSEPKGNEKHISE